MPLETVPGTALRYYLIAFDAAGRERDEPGGPLSRQLANVLSSEPVTDVFLFSHGWQGDVPAAREQYHRWIGAMAANQADIEHLRRARPGFHPLLVGLHWPSLPWGDEELDAEPVSFGPAAGALADEWIDRYAERIADTPPARQALETIFMAAQADLAPVQLPDDVRKAYETLNREVALGSGGAGAEPGADREGFDSESLFQAAGEEPVSFGITDRLFAPLLAPLRTLSFWKMKDRARRFGETGGFKLLNELQQAADDRVRFHLMGHSFGCIAISAALGGPESRGVLRRSVDSLALIQGALSLWSFCADIPAAPGRAGYFHPLVAEGKVAGPIITTQSDYDFAVGRFYPLAAGVRQQINFAPDALPKYGALGAFGACGLGFDAVDLKMLALDGAYRFEAGKIYNLDGSQYICDVRGGGLSGAHSDIARPEVAHAVWSAAYGSR
jgi:hypothetical protein